MRLVAVRCLVGVGLSVMVTACQGPSVPSPVGESVAQILTRDVPPSATCLHVTVTRLSDFTVSSYQGVLSGATFGTGSGESRVSATAYPAPCDAEPAKAPWLAADQLFTFAPGPNTLTLVFRQNPAIVAIDPVFDDPSGSLVVRAGSTRRLGRNNEDVAGPNYALDGWEVKQFAVPSARTAESPLDGGVVSNEVPVEHVVFSMEGQGGMTATPRGLALLPDGTFLAQSPLGTEPLRRFSPTGSFLESWPVVYDASPAPSVWPDGLEVVDATTLVRTAYATDGINCDPSGQCSYALIELLERFTAADGTRQVRVVRQIPLPTPYDQDYPVGVAVVGGRFAVTTLPGFGTSSNLLLIDERGALVAGPTTMTEDLEGLFVSLDGRLGAMDYHGRVSMYDPLTATPRAGEVLSYALGVDLSSPVGLTWCPSKDAFFAVSSELRLLAISPDFTASKALPIDLSSYAQVAAIGVRSDTNQLLVADRSPPVDPVTRTRIPAVDAYDLTTSTRASTIKLSGVPAQGRLRSFAFVEPRQLLLSHYRASGGAADPALDAVVFTHTASGALVSSFDLAPIGVKRVLKVAYLPSDELLLSVVDQFDLSRFLVTSLAGQPRRSVRDTVGGATALAPITSGAYAGDVALVQSEPSMALRIGAP